MFKIFKLYRASQEAQLQWIKKHPVQYLTLNGVLLAAFVWYMTYSDRKARREIETEIKTPKQD